MLLAGRVLVIAALAMLFLAYSNFAPTALSTDGLADYVKNHFVREMIFGVALTIWAIKIAIGPITIVQRRKLALIGSIVILPFWIASAFGWSTDGLAEVWGDAIDPGAAYMLHGGQTTLFYLGLLILWMNVRSSAK